MGATSATGTGPGSAENGLRGLSLENIHKVLNKAENASFGKYIDNNLKFKTNDLDEHGLSQSITSFPLIQIDWYDTKNRIIQLSGNQGLQIEVLKYVRHKKGVHPPGTHPPYPDRIGKRYRPFLLLPFGETQWTISTEWFKIKANWFKFAVFIPAINGNPLKRGPLSVQTIRTHATSVTPREIAMLG